MSLQTFAKNEQPKLIHHKYLSLMPCYLLVFVNCSGRGGWLCKLKDSVNEYMVPNTLLTSLLTLAFTVSVYDLVPVSCTRVQSMVEELV